MFMQIKNLVLKMKLKKKSNKSEKKIAIVGMLS